MSTRHQVQECRSVCEGPKEFRIFIGASTIRQCVQRCELFGKRLAAIQDAPDAYFKAEWYKNWWLGDTRADVPAVLELLGDRVGCS